MTEPTKKLTASNDNRRSSAVKETWYDARRWSLYDGTITSTSSSNGLPPSAEATSTITTETARALIRRTSSAVWDERPQSPEGWTVLVAVIASLAFGYELQLQQRLTCPPFVFLQDDKDNTLMQAIYKRLTRHKDAILSQPIRPSLWVGTRSSLSTGLTVISGHPNNNDYHLQFRELVHLPADGATLALDWEAPMDIPKVRLLQGPIQTHVVVILHGLNNDASASYIKSLQRTITNRGHVAVGMNFRGCGGVPLSNPRPYNGAYTGDLRSVVHMLEGRLAPGCFVFLVGNSLGANLITKYLGEEGLSGTLPSCVKGGVSLANPLEIHTRNNVHTPMLQLMAWGVKLAMLEQWRTWRQTLGYAEFRKALMGVLKASTMDQIDEAMHPLILRNETNYPFAVKLGYECVEDYWKDCSSYRMVQHISVPLLQIIAGDDPVVYNAFQKKLAHCSRNPNVMSVETKCGGHLGWQESPPTNSGHDDDSGFRPTWAGRATADFIDAILTVRPQSATPPETSLNDHTRRGSFSMASWEMPPEPQERNRQQIPILQSRL